MKQQNSKPSRLIMNLTDCLPIPFKIKQQLQLRSDRLYKPVKLTLIQ